MLKDPHASRLGVVGVHFYGTKNEGSMFDESVFGRVYRWTIRSPISTTPPSRMSNRSHRSSIHSQTGTAVQSYIPFTDPVVLEDDVRYLVCANVLNAEIFIGANENDVFDANFEQGGQPVQAYRLDAQWNSALPATRPQR